MSAPAPGRPPARAPARVVIAGLSARAAAQSAVRAGYEVAAADAFGDLDLAACASVIPVPGAGARRYAAGAAARAASGVEADAAAYVGGFENHPRAVERLAAGRTLWGNPAAVLRRVRDPLALARALRARGIRVPAVAAVAARPAAAEARRGAGARAGEARAVGRVAALAGAVAGAGTGAGPPPQLHDAAVAGAEPHHRVAVDTDPPPRSWLLKRRASGGGRGVAAWAAGDPAPRGAVLQERIEGVAGSVAFVADGRRAVPFALSRQLVGEPEFGASGFVYCGSILAAAGDAQLDRDSELYAAAVALADAVTDAFALVGVNGVDFVARDGVPFPVEVNPRYSASMELAERAYGFGVFAAHARACAGELPSFDLARARARAGAVGKAVVYARRDVVLGDTRAWPGDPTVADVPHPGERVAAGRPLCTVFAEGRDAAACRAALVRRAGAVYDAVEGRG